VLVPGDIGGASQLNTVELDTGVCGQFLQLGSDKTASSSPTPTFVLRGDGGLSSYAIAVDGTPLGTFYSTGTAIVCIDVTEPLADGPHQLTGTELAPHAGWVVTPFAFSVDTVPPDHPSKPILSAYSDSGVAGDGITSSRRVNFTGTGAAGFPVQIMRNDGAGIGGATADSDGRWSATTVTLADGTYTITAVTLDRAGNRSARSGGTQLTIDSKPPATPATPTLDDNPGESAPVLRGTATSDVATIYVVCDQVQIGTAAPDGAGNWRFRLTELADGTHTLAVSASDAAGNTTPLSGALTVDLGSPPPPPPPPPPAPAPPPRPRAPASASAGPGSRRPGAAAGQPRAAAGAARFAPGAA
jgi:hypothetical protein